MYIITRLNASIYGQLYIHMDEWSWQNVSFVILLMDKMQAYI